MEATERLFFALWPDDGLQHRLAAQARALAQGGRAMRAANIHLTLAFLGDTPANALPALFSIAGAVRFAPFELPLDRIEWWRHNRIVWCGPSEPPRELAGLAEQLRAGLDRAGVRHDRQAFVPHVTLVRNAAAPAAGAAWSAITWPVGEFALVRSAHIDGRAVYQVLRRFAQAGN